MNRKDSQTFTVTRISDEQAQLVLDVALVQMTVKSKRNDLHRGGIKPLGREPSLDLKSSPSASQDHSCIKSPSKIIYFKE